MTRFLTLVVALALLVPAATPADAQRADFLFERPRATFGVSGGWFMPREEGALYDFVREQLTVEEGAFGSLLMGADLGFWLSNRLELAFGVERAGGSERSEDRHFIGDDGLPIEQTSELRMTRGQVSTRLYLTPRGQSVGRHAWIPAPVSLYAGGGGGLVWYSFTQHGEFVNYQTLDIFRDRMTSSGRGLGAHALGGVDITVSPTVVLRGEFRYHWEDAPVNEGSFRAFDRIDLSGPRATLGVVFRM